MKNARQFVFILFVTILFVSFGTKANACDLSAIRSEYSARGLSGSGIEQEAIDSCLNEQRAQGQAAREQATANSEYALTMYKIKLDYFYKLDEIENNFVKLDANGDCFLSSMNCLESKKIPSDPTTLSADLFLRYMPYKEACSKDLSECIGKKINSTQTQQPIKTDDQMCSDKFGSNWKWDGNAYCVCKDGYTQKNGSCVTYDQSCNISYPNTNFLKIDAIDGRRICDCKVGYQWNNSETACEKATAGIIPSTINNSPFITTSDAVPTVNSIPGISIPEGAIIKTANNPDVYIVKYVGAKKFIRLVLSPSVFKSYGHLEWENIITVPQTTLDSYIVSDYVRAVGDTTIYHLYPKGDTGEKRLLKLNAQGHDSLLGIFDRNYYQQFDYDSVYEINAVDRDSYITK